MSEDAKKKALDTQIRISSSTRESLKRLGGMGDNYDDVIRRLLQENDRLREEVKKKRGARETS